MEASTVASPDGRSLRRERSHEAAVEAILDLLVEGNAQPTAEQVAQRSGLSIRSIFRLFDDMEALHRAAIDRQAERIMSMLVTLPMDGPVGHRIDRLVLNRAEIFDTISPVRRLAVRLAPQSEIISEELARANRFFRAQVAAVFGAELDVAADPAQLLDAIDVATSWETWERLRVGQRLPIARTAGVIGAIVSALIAAAAASDTAER